MASEAVRILRESEPALFDDRFYDAMFQLGDEGMLEHLNNWLGQDIGGDLIAPLHSVAGTRTLHYRRLLTLTYGPMDPLDHPGQTNVYENIREMFDGFMKGGAIEARKYRLFEARVRHTVMALIGPSARSHHVLVDVPDPRVEGHTSFFVYRDHQGCAPQSSPGSPTNREPITDRSDSPSRIPSGLETTCTEDSRVCLSNHQRPGHMRQTGARSRTNLA